MFLLLSEGIQDIYINKPAIKIYQKVTGSKFDFISETAGNCKTTKKFLSRLSYLEKYRVEEINNPEIVRDLEGEICKSINAYELKFKPYRAGFMKIGKNILIVNFWKVQENMGKRKRDNIENTCLSGRRLWNDFEKFIKEIIK